MLITILIRLSDKIPSILEVSKLNYIVSREESVLPLLNMYHTIGDLD